MQYGVEVRTYKKIKSKNNRELKFDNALFINLSIVTMAFLLSRVMFSVAVGNELAPFGVVYLLAVSMGKKVDKTIIAFVGMALGYISIYKSVESVSVYILMAFIILCYIKISEKLRTSPREYICFLVMFSVFLIYGLLVTNQPIGISLVSSGVKVAVMIPLYYVLRYAINCTEELRTNYFFSTEELISIGIFICLLVVGIGEVEIFSISIRGIIALALVVSIAYVSGIGLGAAIGVAMGFVMGVNNNDILTLISIYSSCGLIVGIFKDTGRVFSVMAYMVIYCTMIMYSDIFTVPLVVEAFLAGIIILLIPRNIILNALKEVNQEKKAEMINNNNIQGIKNEFVDRINDLKNALASVSIAVNDLSENDCLLLKSKGTAMVENLADRVCSDCELRGRCWDRNLHSTFSSFSELITSCEDNKIIFPFELEKRCVKKSSLLRNTQEIINNYIINEALKSRLVEGRNLVVNHINNMSLTMGDIVSDFNKDIAVCTDVDRVLRKALNKERIEYEDIFCYLDRKGRLKIKVNLRDCEGSSYCFKKIIPLINKCTNAPMSINSQGCSINPSNGKCFVVIEEMPKYQVMSYAKSIIKDGERFCGDSYSFGKNDDGLYLTMISDGMGSGPEAGIESKVAVDLVEKFIGVGFSTKTAINTVNSIMGMKFSEDEKFATLDLSVIDLYTGEVEFVKVGGVVSFIKRGSKVEIVKSKSLPFGILDIVDVSSEKSKLKHGDIIITISDGLLDIDKKNLSDSSWLEEYLKQADSNPEALSRDIIEKAKVLTGGRVPDDMTVAVSKVYSVY